jgi:ribonucleoside-diphosphate reductase alpha chain
VKLRAYFTQNLSDPYEGVEFKEVTYEDVVFVAPTHWSQTAIDIVFRKYRRKTPLPDLPNGETDIRHIFERLTLCWKSWAKKSGLITKKTDLKIFQDELKYMLVHQMAAPNSPQWFNTGLFEAYGLKGEAQGHYYCEKNNSGKLSVKKSKSAYERPQPHACFIQGLKDDLVGKGGIMDLWQREALVFKFGSGSGTNFSTLRAAGEPLASGGTSSGLMGWLKIGDRAAGAIKSGGTTRRAAKMVCLDGDHPEVEDFIRWKADEEERLAAMKSGHLEITRLKKLALKQKLSGNWQEKARKRGIDESFISVVEAMNRGELKDEGLSAIDSDWQGPGYESLSGQNANNSVRLSDEFFKALESDGDWNLRARTTGEVVKTLKARKLWQLIGESAWKSADPGLQFSSTINEWHPCPKAGPIRASNPCSEYMFLDDTACNLASLNVAAFYQEDLNLEALNMLLLYGPWF